MAIGPDLHERCTATHQVGQGDDVDLVRCIRDARHTAVAGHRAWFDRDVTWPGDGTRENAALQGTPAKSDDEGVVEIAGGAFRFVTTAHTTWCVARGEMCTLDPEVAEAVGALVAELRRVRRACSIATSYVEDGAPTIALRRLHEALEEDDAT